MIEIELTKRLLAMQEHIDSISSSINRENQTLETLRKESSRLKDENSTFSERNLVLTKENKKLEIENMLLKEKNIGEINVHKKSLAKVLNDIEISSKDRDNQLQEHRNLIDASLSQVNTHTKKVIDLEGKVSEIMIQRKTIASQLSNDSVLVEKQITSLVEKKEAIEATISLLEKTVSEKNDILADTIQSITKKEQEYNTLSEEFTLIKKALASEQSEFDETVSSMKETIAKLNNEIQILESEKDIFIQQKIQFQNERKEIEDKEFLIRKKYEMAGLSY